MHRSSTERVVIIGAGPAGLTAAYELGKAGVRSIVLEKDEVVGGLARTVSHRGYHFDIGGHRFFTKVPEVEAMWREVLPDGDFLKRPRLSRIYYRGRFFHYPLRLGNAVAGLGPWNSFLIGLSYLRARMFPTRQERSFEDWVSNRFGRRLYRIFFKTYTEKVWGIPCDRISAEWAAQRIKGLSLATALRSALFPSSTARKNGAIKTLIDSFDYPKRGPGMMWETVADRVSQNGSALRLQAEVERVVWSGHEVHAVEIAAHGGVERIEGSHFISTMPVRELVRKLSPTPPSEVQAAASALKYRDFLTVALIVDRKELFPDNWIYVHDRDVAAGRIQNFKNWSPDMVPNPDKSCIGLEYFCREGDALWNKTDAELIEQAKCEMARLGLLDPAEVEDGAVVRMPKAYPVYDGDHVEALRTIRSFLDDICNLHLVGRNGMHKYNNQDHSMLTAMLAVRNILGARFDVWAVNADSEYLEELSPEEASLAARLVRTQPLVPTEIGQDGRTTARPSRRGSVSGGLWSARDRTRHGRSRERDRHRQEDLRGSGHPFGEWPGAAQASESAPERPSGARRRR